MTVADTTAQSASAVAPAAYTGQTNQMWRIELCNLNTYQLFTQASNYLTLDINSNNTAELAIKSELASQRFEIVRQEELLFGRSGIYYIMIGDQYLTLSPDLDSYCLVQYPDESNGRSLWSFERVEKGTANIYNFSEFVIGISETWYDTKISGMGYTPNYFIDEPRDDAFSALQNASIWFHTGHGGAGFVQFTDGNIRYANVDALSNNELAGLRCFITLGCSSGSYIEDTDYNLIQSIYDKGAQFALGFTHTQYTGVAETWLARFIEYANEGHTIAECIEYADVVANLPIFGTGMKYYMGDDTQRLNR